MEVLLHFVDGVRLAAEDAIVGEPGAASDRSVRKAQAGQVGSAPIGPVFRTPSPCKTPGLP